MKNTKELRAEIEERANIFIYEAEPCWDNGIDTRGIRHEFVKSMKSFAKHLEMNETQKLRNALYWIEAWLVEDAESTQGISREEAVKRVREALRTGQ